MTRTLTLMMPLALVLSASACDSEDDDNKAAGGATGGSGTGGAGGAASGAGQVPPTGAAAIDGWLAAGSYKQWHCEAAHHPARSPSPHGTNRICSNDALSAHASGPYPVGAASVKELYDGAGQLVGHAVSLHAGAGNTGADWYWYEKMAGSVVVDSRGDSGTAKEVCVGCHMAAGSDAAHPGHDFVYTQVK